MQEDYEDIVGRRKAKLERNAPLDKVANTMEMAVKGGVILPSRPGLSTSSRNKMTSITSKEKLQHDAIFISLLFEGKHNITKSSTVLVKTAQIKRAYKNININILTNHLLELLTKYNELMMRCLSSW
ncbi:hypothetical protein YC2023_011370 [Brassica napus]